MIQRVKVEYMMNETIHTDHLSGVDVGVQLYDGGGASVTIRDETGRVVDAVLYRRAERIRRTLGDD